MPIVDARGKYLIPGLWDMHVHPYARETAESARLIPQFIVAGVTGIRDLATYMPLDTVRQWQREIRAGHRVGPPHQLLAGPLVEGGTAPGEVNGRLESLPAGTPELARQSVETLNALGVDVIKTHSDDLPRDAYFALAAAARAVQRPLVGHLPVSVTVTEAADSGQRSLEHIGLLLIGGFTDSAKNQLPECVGDAASLARCAALARRLMHDASWLTPTLLVMVQATSRASSSAWAGIPARIRPYLPSGLHAERVPPDTAVPLWLTGAPLDAVAPGDRITPLLRQLDLGLLQRAGIPLLAGTDMPLMPGSDWPLPMYGLGVHLELALFVAKGMTPLGALQTATLNPAKYLNGTDSLGTVAAGKLADLVLLDANPLADIRNIGLIRAVVADGRYYDRAALDAIAAAVVEGAPRVKGAGR